MATQKKSSAKGNRRKSSAGKQRSARSAKKASSASKTSMSMSGIRSAVGGRKTPSSRTRKSASASRSISRIRGVARSTKAPLTSDLKNLQKDVRVLGEDVMSTVREALPIAGRSRSQQPQGRRSTARRSGRKAA